MSVIMPNAYSIMEKPEEEIERVFTEQSGKEFDPGLIAMTLDILKLQEKK